MTHQSHVAGGVCATGREGRRTRSGKGTPAHPSHCTLVALVRRRCQRVWTGCGETMDVHGDDLCMRPMPIENCMLESSLLLVGSRSCTRHLSGASRCTVGVDSGADKASTERRCSSPPERCVTRTPASPPPVSHQHGTTSPQRLQCRDTGERRNRISDKDPTNRSYASSVLPF